MEWFKVQTELLNNRKFQSDLTDTFKVRLLNIWCLCASLNGSLPSVVEMAFRLRISDGEMIDTIKELKSSGFLDEVAPGRYLPHDWEEHNPPASVNDRVKKHREKQKTANVTPRNSEVTHGVTERNAQCNGATLQTVTSVTTRREEREEKEYTPLPPLTIQKPIQLPESLARAFSEVREIHDPGDGDNALRLLVSMFADGKVTEADAAQMADGMRTWKRCADWCDRDPAMLPKGSPAKTYFFQLYEWVANRAWLAKPAPSAEAKAEESQRGGYVQGPPPGWVHPSLKTKNATNATGSHGLAVVVGAEGKASNGATSGAGSGKNGIAVGGAA